MKKSFTHRLLVTLSLTSILFNTVYPLIPTYKIYAEDVIPVISESSSSSVDSSSSSSIESSSSSTSSSTLSESSSSASSSEVSSESSSSVTSSSTSSAVSFEEVIPEPKKGVNKISIQTQSSSSSSSTFQSIAPNNIVSQSVINGQCPSDYWSSLNCTANDVSVGNVTNIVITDDGCTSLSDTVSFTGTWNVESNANGRYNIGLWIASAGQSSALNGSCTATTLPVSPVPPYVNLDNNACGDINSGTVIATPISVTVQCSDPDGNNKLNIPYVTTWSQQAGTPTSCNGPLDTEPGTKSKCNSETGFEVNIPVPHFAKVEVKKALSPSSNSGTFNLKVDGVDKVTNVGNNGSTGIVSVTAGTSAVPGATHTVGESAYTGTNLNDYVSTYSCIRRNTTTTVASGSGIGPVSINFLKDDDIVCTFTNTLKSGTITVQKIFDGINPGTFTGACFTLNPNPGNGQVCAVDPSGIATFSNVPYGTYSVIETSLNTGYTITGNTCTSLVLNSVTPTQSCNVTNKRDTGSLTIDKVVVPSNDTTSFSFTRTGADLQTVNFSLAGSTTPVTYTLPTGTYSVAESPINGWVNTSSICTDGSTLNNISVDNGENITCTVTNVLTPVITIALDTTHEVGDDHIFTVTVGYNGSEGFVPVADGTIVTSNVTPSGALVNDSDCTNGTTSGTCNIIINSTTPASYVVNASSSVVIDGYTFNISTNASPASVTFVDGRILISPLTATNNVNEAHTFTVNVYQNPGNGEVVSPNNLVTFSLLNNTAGASFVSGNTCTTNASGVCSVQINTSTPGNVEVNASANMTVNTVNITRVTDGSHGSSVNGSKSYVAGRIVIVKQTAPDLDSTKFEFSSSYTPNFELSDGESKDSGFLPVGIYSVSELTENGWVNTLASCDDQSPVSAINLSAGEVVTCTFTNVKNGHLIVQKTTLPSGDLTQFSINTTGTGNITGGSAGSISDANDYDYEVTPGTYSINESVPAGWSKTGDTCQNVVVAAGETKTCEITNTKLGTITIIKDSQPNDVTDFGFTTAGGLTPSTFILDDDSDPTLNNAQTYSNLLPGSYTFTEMETPGFTLTAINCSYIPDGFQGNGMGSSVELRSAGIDLAAGENVICTFTNTKKAHLVIDKVTNPSNDPQEFRFLVDKEGLLGWDFSLKDSDNPSNDEVEPGVYSVTETAIAGWDLTSVICSDGSPANAVDLSAGETVTCTFTNTKRSHLIVDKVTLPSGDPQVFRFTTSGSGSSDFSLDDLSNPNNQELLPGTYGVSETPVNGWVQTSATCTDGSPISAVVLTPGETVTCTFTNTKNGHLIVQKTTLPSSDLTQFSVNTTGTGNITGGGAGSVSDAIDYNYEVAPGTYEVVESVPAGWSKTGDTCQNVVVAAGETKTCEITNTKLGTITIVKDSQPNDVTDFGFTSTGLVPTSFSLDDDPNDQTLLNEWTYNNVEPGSFTVKEDIAPGFELTSLICIDPTNDSLGNVGTRIASIELSAGESVVCTFTNIKKAHLIVDKVTYPIGDTQSFNFNVSGRGLQAFSLTDTDEVKNFELDPRIYSVTEVLPSGWIQTSAICDDGSAVNAIDLSAGETVICTFTNTKKSHLIVDKVTLPSGDPQVFNFTTSGSGYSNFSLDDLSNPNNQELVPGTYGVSETGISGWDLTSATCNNGSPVNAVVLNPGETVTCTFTNTKRAHLIVDKETLPSGDTQSFNFNVTGNGYSGFSLTDQANPNNQELVPGTYGVSESLPSGWLQTSAVCNDGSEISEIVLSPGETVICLFTNTKKGHIIVDKVTLPSGDPQSFDFTTTGTGYTGFSLTDEASPNDQEVNPGTYGVSETSVNGWVQTSAVCDNDQSIDEITVAPGQTITCTFTNTKNAHLIVDKVTLPSNDPQVFNFFIKGIEYLKEFSLSDQSNPEDTELAPGYYAVKETDLYENWRTTNIVCDNQSNSSEMELLPGETVTCTFTNTKNSTLIVQKTTNPSNDPTLFEINLVSENDRISPTGVVVDTVSDSTDKTYSLFPGVYSVNEIVPEGWVQTGNTCNDLVLEPGETKTCLFTNTKLSSIKIVKNASVNALDNFIFTDPDGKTFILDDDEGVVGADDEYSNFKNFISLIPGEYTFTEANPTELWGLKDVVCKDSEGNTYTNVVTLVNGVKVNLGAGVDITCTFNNVKGEVLGEQTGEVLAVTGDTSTYLQLLGLFLILGSLGVLVIRKTRKKYSK